MENTYAFFSRLVGTMAVILLVAAYAGSTQIFTKYIGRQKTWRFIVCTGLFGGVFGIYGNISGIDFCKRFHITASHTNRTSIYM